MQKKNLCSHRDYDIIDKEQMFVLTSADMKGGIYGLYCHKIF